MHAHTCTHAHTHTHLPVSTSFFYWLTFFLLKFVYLFIYVAHKIVYLWTTGLPDLHLKQKTHTWGINTHTGDGEWGGGCLRGGLGDSGHSAACCAAGAGVTEAQLLLWGNCNHAKTLLSFDWTR